MLRLQSIISTSDTMRVCSIGRRGTLKSVDSVQSVIFRNHVTINKQSNLSTILPTTTYYSTNRLFIRNSFCSKILRVKEFHTRIIPLCQADKTSKMNFNQRNFLIKNPEETDLNTKHSAKQLLHKENAYHSELLKEFPVPISSLHNIYSIVQSQLRIDQALTTRYEESNNGWICKCNVRWPEVKEFTATDRSKRAAASAVALKCLHWLKDIHKLKNGLPVVFDLNKINSALQMPSKVEISEELKSKVKKLLRKYETFVQPIILKTELPKLEGPENIMEDGSFAKSSVFSSLKQRNIISIAKINPAMRNSVLLSKLKERVPVDYDLPINAYREKILKLVEENQIVVIKGDTGCGKTTQVPQFIMDSFIERGEASNCHILVSEPRKISAISLAERIAYERGEKLGDVIGYKVKLRHKLPQTPGAILFCTTGIILKKIQENPTLSGCSHIIIDEAHERKVDVDIILALLKRIVKKNKDLKVIIMSATINAEMFQEYFDCASIDVPGTAFPVKMHFIDDIAQMVNVDKSFEQDYFRTPQIECDDIARTVQWISDNKPPGAILCFLPGWNEIVQVDTLLKQLNRTRTQQVVLPLHSHLTYSDQQKIFDKPPQGKRKIILSTDIAETGITVRDVVYVVDCAARKEIRWDNEKETDTMQNYRISLANLHQRRGRAGRVQPGESYHFVSRREYNKLKDFPDPEIKCVSLERVSLDCKLCIDDKIEDFLSELPEPPNREVVRTSVKNLINLGALDKEERLTILGKKVAYLPLAPILGKTLIYASIFGCLDPILSIITLYSMNMEVFRNSMLRKAEIRSVKRRFSLSSDHIALARIYEQWEAYLNESEVVAENFSEECGIIHIRLSTLRKHRNQFSNQIAHQMGMRESCLAYPVLNKYSKSNEFTLAVLLSGVDHVLKHTRYQKTRNRLVRNDKLFHDENNAYTYTTPESVNHNREIFPSNYLTYVKKTFATDRRKMLVRDCSLISPLTVLLFSQGHLFGYEYYAVQSEDPDDKNVTVKNQILIKISGKENVSIVCDEKLADLMFRLRDSIWAVVRYLVDNQGQHFLLQSKDLPIVDRYKDEMLSTLNEILTEAGEPIANIETQMSRENVEFSSDNSYDGINFDDDDNENEEMEDFKL